MRKTLILVLLLTGMGTLYGQRIHGFVSSGFTLSQIEGDELKGFSKWGYTGGVGAIVGFDRHQTWNLSVEALFTQRGSYNGTGDPYSMSLRLNYVEIPLILHWRDPWGGMLVGAGLSYSRLTQQPHAIWACDTTYFLPDTSDFSFLSGDLAALFEIRFPVWRGLQFNIRWKYSILAVKKDWEFTEYRGTNPDGTPHATKWTNDCYNNSLEFRLIWQF